MYLDQQRIDQWLREDLGHHDVVNNVPGSATADLVTTDPGVAAGLESACQVFEHLGADATTQVDSGTRVDAGTTLLTVSGTTRTLLRGERISTNLIGHASGIATRTHRAVEIAADVDSSVTVAATRKTTPGLRGIEKRAVAAGGGDTHRLDLAHAVLIKENHIAELGLSTAIERMRSQKSFVTTLEVEVESIEQARQAIKHDIDVVLLDNFSPAEIKTAVDVIGETAVTEASGQITLANLAEYAQTGVDVISMGTLTHSAPTLDCSFRIQ